MLPVIDSQLPSSFAKYYEPFVGGGAVLFHLAPLVAAINDSNEELINLYRVIKDTPCELIRSLQTHANEKEYYYKIRAIDRNPSDYRSLTAVDRASRILFLNRTCFNGLFRVNSSGEYNVPFGRYKNPDFVKKDTILAVSRYLRDNDIEIFCGDYKNLLATVGTGDFVYLDPPYDPVSESSNFTGYTKGGFNKDDQAQLKEQCDVLHEKRAFFLYQIQQQILFSTCTGNTPLKLFLRKEP